MKLRNKKTGGIKNVECITIFDRPEILDVSQSVATYYTLAKLDEEWEDYDPDEPLIEHEIVRKALKWWAVSNGITGDASLLFVGDSNGFICENQFISFDSAVYDMSEKLISGNTYDLEELCGDIKEEE